MNSTRDILYKVSGVKVDVLLVVLCALASTGQTWLTLIVNVIISFHEPSMILLVPLCLYSNNSNPSKFTAKRWSFIYIMAFFGLCWAIVVLYLTNTDKATETVIFSFVAIKNTLVNCIWNTQYQCTDIIVKFWHDRFHKLFEYITILSNKRAVTYLPSLGIRWYLDAQMLPEYRTYFELLFAIQPIICSWILYEFITPLYPIIAIHLGIAIIILFRREISIVDVIFAIILLVQHKNVLSNMRHRSIIIVGILTPIVLSPLMLNLWAVYGTGNANYFFFQGVCLWLFCAFGITEFTNALLKIKVETC